MTQIYIENSTILDCVYLQQNQNPTGASWFVSAMFDGYPNNEGMIIDFSLAKKTLKATVDDLFDHRFVVPSPSIFNHASDTKNSLVTGNWAIAENNFQFIMLAPLSAFCVLPAQELTSSVQVAAILERQIAEELIKRLPKNVTQITIKLKNTEEHKKEFFAYTHSLQHHKGNCQRFHGHGGVIKIEQNGVVDWEKTTNIIKSFGNKYFVNKNMVKNISALTAPRILSLLQNQNTEQLSYVSYQACQGEVHLVIPKPALIELDSESTIEAMARFFYHTLGNSRTNFTVIANEGLHKGACYSGT